MELELESILLPGIEEKRPLVIAGPCSAETEEQVMDTAKQLAAKGMKIFRAGIWKPRTKPGGFEGVGVEGLAWLKEVKKETGMYVSIHRSSHSQACVRMPESRNRYTLGRCPHYRQSFCRTGNSRCPERRGYPCLGKEPRKSGSGIMDRCHGAHQ